MGNPIPKTAALCVAHASPTTGRCPTVAQYNELHHVIPVEWQKFWQPPEPWPNEGVDPFNRVVRLWDARTVALCRTGHGNTHFWLARLMHAMPASVMDPNPPTGTMALATAEKVVWAQARREGRKVNAKEFEISRQGVLRLVAVGGDLGAYVKAGKWGAMI